MGYAQVYAQTARKRLNQKPQDELKGQETGLGIPQNTGELSEDDRENFEERAGIMQYCGGLTREEAEREALTLIVTDKQALQDNKCLHSNNKGVTLCR